MRPGRGTSVRVVAELVDMETSFRIGIVACDMVGDLGGRGLGFLLKNHRSFHIRVPTEDCDCDEKHTGQQLSNHDTPLSTQRGSVGRL